MTAAWPFGTDVVEDAPRTEEPPYGWWDETRASPQPPIDRY
ncbi:hypothetical protein ABZ682_19435 [Streptomyces griseoviridis]